MKIKCEIIRDLLPLYYDDVCSEESHKLVEEHLASCPKCRAELIEMEEEIIAKSPVEDISLIKNISKRWKRDIFSAFLLGALLLSTIASIGCAIAFNAIDSYVTAEGILEEPFALLPLAYFFGMVAILSGVGLLITNIVKRYKKKK